MNYSSVTTLEDLVKNQQNLEDKNSKEYKKALPYNAKCKTALSAIRLHHSSPKRFDLYDIYADGDPVKLGCIAPQIEKELESPVPEPQLKEVSDAVCFYGVNSKSEFLLVRIARGANQAADAWLHLKLANGKSYNLTETSGCQQPFEGNCELFSCGNLQMHYLSPMRRWRIFFCGMLKETSEEKEKMVFVKFLLLWKASSDVFDLLSDLNPEHFSKAIAKAEWTSKPSSPFKKVKGVLNFYAQTGVISGTVSVNDGPDHEIYLFGDKRRSQGKVQYLAGAKFTNVVGYQPKHGLGFHLCEASVPNLFSDLQYGFAVSPDGNLQRIKDFNLSFPQPYTPSSGKGFKALFNAARAYEMQGDLLGEQIILRNRQGWNGTVEIRFMEFTIGEKKGYGFLMNGEIHDVPRIEAVLTQIPKFPKDTPWTVKITDDISHFGEISGGKGSSLGKLTKLSQRSRTFSVPKGIVVTTAAYEGFLRPVIEDAMKQLQDVVYGIVKGDPKTACDMVSTIIDKSLLPEKISDSIKKELEEVFGDEVNELKFAVRSSATGEDSSSLSAAGQMDTFLGVQGLSEIFNYVKKCWASQFGYTAIEYKRRHGQILNSPMAVVVQEMVASEVSGVLFTCDPVTNNPSVITITSNYGLGETVVSGSVEPDTVVLKRNPKGELQLDSICVGSKLQRIVMKEGIGTTTESIPEELRSGSCLTDERAMELAKIAVKVEEYYKSTRDIEWAISSDTIYLLQSRPVTNMAAETDYEMKHEFDSATRSEIDSFTTANAGEVMPGATSPLGLQFVFKYFDIVLKRLTMSMGMPDSFLQSKYFDGLVIVFFNQIMMTTEIITRYGVDTPLSRGATISLFGRIVDDPDILNNIREKMEASTAPPPKQTIATRLTFLKMLHFHGFGWDGYKKQLNEYPLSFLNCNSAHDTFRALMNSFSDFIDAGIRHQYSSEASSSWNTSLFQILSEAHNGVIGTDVYSDFAKLLATSTNVESANIPHAMQEVASQIEKDYPVQEFVSMPVEEALNWLQNSTSLAGKMFRDFMQRHGHRCLKELDVHSFTWEMNPKPLVKLLQKLTGTGKEIRKKAEINDGKLIAELQSHLGTLSKLKLRYILPNCRESVRSRENGKSCQVKCFDYLRKGCRRLAKQMVCEGRIPDEDLLFYMTFDEIDYLLQTRAPSLISRAISRRRFLPVLDNYKFPEIIRGYPRPINEDIETSETYEFVADLTMKGTPVSQGVTKGYARVVLDLLEAPKLKPEEILITHSTDIGWSPYFPIISGIVTEVGGLVSHGAVVSREYGLPCVVGLHGATKRFRTGDFVLLDGKRGILQRLPHPGQ